MQPPRQQRTRGLALLVAALCIAGAAARLLPLVDGSDRFLQQFPTEDGYLMMTIARSVALGRGMTTADGLIASNGTQPAFNVIEASCFWLLGGDKRAGVFAIQVVELFVSAAAAWAFFALGRRILRERAWGTSAAALAAATWYASSNVVPHTMNCLETGWYMLMVLLSVLQWHRLWTAATASASVLWKPALLSGVVLGLTLWARIDAVFLVAALTVVHAAWAWRNGWVTLRLRLMESALAGSVAVAIISPWLLYGKLRFGSFMPVSGLAESADHWFSNTALLPASLFRYLTIVLPIPHEYTARTSVIAGCAAVGLAWVAGLALAARRLTTSERWLAACGTLLTTCLCIYYGIAFGAGHFLDRYLFPASPFMALATVAAGVALANRAAHSRWWSVAGLASVTGLVILVAALNGRAYRDGRKHMHFQVVDWVGRNLADTTWVAAVQTGTLGFFHDRTVNLDGKVNPEALSLLKQRRIPDYVVDSRWGKDRASIDYVVDWSGIAGWDSLAPVHSNFDLIVDDPGLNLAVLRRKSPAAYSLR